MNDQNVVLTIVREDGRRWALLPAQFSEAELAPYQQLFRQNRISRLEMGASVHFYSDMTREKVFALLDELARQSEIGGVLVTNEEARAWEQRFDQRWPEQPLAGHWAPIQHQVSYADALGSVRLDIQNDLITVWIDGAPRPAQIKLASDERFCRWAPGL